ncbi:hypothetical protein ABFP60_11100 [Clostridioides difficile]
MGNYNYQYKKYYQELQNKNLSKNSSPVYRSNSFEEIYGGNIKRKDNKEFFSSMVNVFIYQLVVVVFMLMAAFYLKYSPQEKESYENIKAVINDNTYSDITEENKSFNITEVINKISDYIKTNLGGEKSDF